MAARMHRQPVRKLARFDLCDHLLGGDVDSKYGAVNLARDVGASAIRRKRDAARPAPNINTGDLAPCLHVDDVYLRRIFSADIYPSAVGTEHSVLGIFAF